MATEVKENVEGQVQDQKPEMPEKCLSDFLHNEKLFDLELENPDTGGKTK